MEDSFTLTWDEGPSVEQLDMCEEVVVQDIDNGPIEHATHDDNVLYIPDNVHNNVIYMNSEEVLEEHQEEIPLTEEAYMHCDVAEEVIAEEWIESQSGERVEVVGNLATNQVENTDDIEIPLPTDQDEYTASRPYPCDFCSRRFRKKANLINHMVAHQTDRPHGCNLCGARYIRKCDLMNHLKIHAYVPEPEAYEDDEDDMNYEYELQEPERPRKKRTTSKKRKSKLRIKEEVMDEDKYSAPSRSYDYVDEDMRLLNEMTSSARTVEYGSPEYNEIVPPENHPVSEPRYPITDPRKPFVCQHCGVGFAREKALASHARIHGGDSPFECETCGDMFWDMGLLKEHVKNKHGEQAVNMSYDDDDDEDYVDDDERYGDFFCQTCGMTFHRQDLLRRHNRIHVKEEYVNDSEFGHVCNVCGDSFSEALELLAHAEIHTRLNMHRCLLCGESFDQELAIATHISQRHAKTMPPNSCMLCGKSCKDRRTLLKHSWEHSKEKSFSCSKCAKSFHNRARLRRHMVSHRNKSVTCDICGEDFPDGRSLMNHRHSHTNVSGRQFPCRECGKTFGSRSSQQIHIRIHTGERPYGCRFCWKAFADGGTLRKHERIHTGEKPYACAVCPRAFNQRVVLREHIRSHHSGPDAKFGTSLTPYCCAVCNDMFATAQDLIVHLIQHCDLNTAMRRQPQVGPRKYKRRRKLKPHELERITAAEKDQDDTDYRHSDSDDNIKRKLGNKKSKRVKEESFEPPTFHPYEPPAPPVNSVVPKSTRGRKKKVVVPTEAPPAPMPSRPKMIHTQKTRVPVEVIGTDGNKIRHKTKTLITRTAPTVLTNSVEKMDRNGERNRPRTKNVSYHVLQPDKYTTATFDSNHIVPSVKSEPETKRENYMDLEEMFKHMHNEYEEDEEHTALGIESNFIVQNIEVDENIEQEVCIEEEVTDSHLEEVISEEMTTHQSESDVVPMQLFKAENHYQEDDTKPFTYETRGIKPELETVSLHELAELSMQHAQNKFKCEMCSASFSDRAQLLIHVPIHI